MPPIKDTESQEPQGAPGMPDLPFDESTVPAEGAGGPKAAQEAEDKRYAALLAQVSELKGKLSSLTDQNLTLMGATTPKLAPTPPKPLSWDGLPDPAMDGPGYASAVAERLEAHEGAKAQYEAEQARQRSTRDGQLASMWEDFSLEHPEYAGDEAKVEFAAQKVLSKATARGIDTERYILGHSDRFMGDVMKEMDKIFGKPAPEGAEEDTQAASVARKRASRTDGMLGGVEGGSRPAAKSTKPPSMFDDIKQFQLKHGYY